MGYGGGVSGGGAAGGVGGAAGVDGYGGGGGGGGAGGYRPYGEFYANKHFHWLEIYNSKWMSALNFEFKVTMNTFNRVAHFFFFLSWLSIKNMCWRAHIKRASK